MSMDSMRCKTLCTIVLATLIPQLSLAATPQADPPSAKPLLTDIALQKGGVLVGRLTSKKGKLRDAQKIVIRQIKNFFISLCSGEYICHF